MMPAPMIALMACVASSTESKTPSIVRTPCGIARQADPDFGDDAERSFAADDGADQIGSGRIFDGSADLDDIAFGGDDFDAEHVVDRDAVLERVGPPAFVETLPPIVQAPWLEGSGA